MSNFNSLTTAALNCPPEVFQSNGITKEEFIEFFECYEATDWDYLLNIFNLYIDQKLTLVDPAIGWVCNNQKGYIYNEKSDGKVTTFEVSIFDLSNEELALQLMLGISDANQVSILNEEVRKELPPEILAALK